MTPIIDEQKYRREFYSLQMKTSEKDKRRILTVFGARKQAKRESLIEIFYSTLGIDSVIEGWEREKVGET